MYHFNMLYKHFLYPPFPGNVVWTPSEPQMRSWFPISYQTGPAGLQSKIPAHYVVCVFLWTGSGVFSIFRDKITQALISSASRVGCVFCILYCGDEHVATWTTGLFHLQEILFIFSYFAKLRIVKSFFLSLTNNKTKYYGLRLYDSKFIALLLLLKTFCAFLKTAWRPH